MNTTTVLVLGAVVVGGFLLLSMRNQGLQQKPPVGGSDPFALSFGLQLPGQVFGD